MLLYFLVLLWHFIYQQAVAQCSSSRLLISSKRQDNIILILASLHWLPVSFMIDFKIWLITFSACQGSQLYFGPLTVCEPLRSLGGPRQSCIGCWLCYTGWISVLLQITCQDTILLFLLFLSLIYYFFFYPCSFSTWLLNRFRIPKESCLCSPSSG